MWEYARDNGFMLVSKDEDFHQLSFLYGHPPKVVWLNLGNCTTHEAEQDIRQHYSDLADFAATDEGSFLIIGAGKTE